MHHSLTNHWQNGEHYTEVSIEQIVQNEEVLKQCSLYSLLIVEQHKRPVKSKNLVIRR